MRVPFFMVAQRVSRVKAELSLGYPLDNEPTWEKLRWLADNGFEFERRYFIELELGLDRKGLMELAERMQALELINSRPN